MIPIRPECGREGALGSDGVTDPCLHAIQEAG